MELYYLMSITDRDRAEDMAALYRDAGLNLVTTMLGRGTATPQQLALYGLSRTEKAVTGAVVDIPIFMPLVGMDKKDIISIAREIGTLDTSILPYEDCCTVFTPKHPKTKPTLGQVVNAEKKLDREALIARALENVEKIKVTYHDEPLL